MTFKVLGCAVVISFILQPVKMALQQRHYVRTVSLGRDWVVDACNNRHTGLPKAGEAAAAAGPQIAPRSAARNVDK